ncbi:MAG TPA: hypothetical protein VF753_04430 [Terriglobales bacterium]
MLRRLAVLLLLLVPFCRANNQYSETREVAWDFSAGGRIELHLRYGDLKVLPSQGNHISIRYKMQSDHADFISKVSTRFEISPSSALLRIDAPRNGSVDVELEVPERSNLLLRVTAGDAVVGPIEGDKNIETYAGDIRIDLPEHFSAGAIDVKTHAGEVTAPWGKPNGWIGGSLRYDGGGKYNVHAHTFAGDIELKEQDGVEARKCPCD